MFTSTLIIDKRIELSTKYKKAITLSNNSVAITNDITSALKFIQGKEPDLIIISDSIKEDLPMFCKKIRVLTYNMRPIIVAMSKSSEIDDRLKVLEYGADDFIGEPVNIEEFKMRIFAHLRREIDTNTNPISQLPIKSYTLRALKRTIASNSVEWAAMLVKIENFSIYKENYTQLASDKLIQTYCAIIHSVLGEKDFVGDLDENKFLIITNIEKVEKIASFLTFAFDSVCEKFYSKADVERGYMLIQGADYEGRRAEFVHTSIGIITSDINAYTTPQQAITALENTLFLAKLPRLSNYAIDRARLTGENAILQKDYNKKILIQEEDEALALLLKTALLLKGFSAEYLNCENFEISEIPSVIIFDDGEKQDNSVLEKCKLAHEKFENTKIIITSIYHEKEKILSAGADLYLPKPYELSQIVNWVDKFVKEFNA